MAVRTRKMVAMVLETGSARTYTLDTYQGDVSISGNMAGSVESIPILDRGTYAEAVEGDDQFPTMTVTLWHDGRLTDAAAQKIIDMINKQGAASADVTTDPGGVGAPWHIKCTVTVTHPGGGVDTYTAGNARASWDYAAAADGNTISLTLTCYRPTGGANPIVWT